MALVVVHPLTQTPAALRASRVDRPRRIGQG
jgi:hypothetical protein